MNRSVVLWPTAEMLSTPSPSHPVPSQEAVSLPLVDWKCDVVVFKVDHSSTDRQPKQIENKTKQKNLKFAVKESNLLMTKNILCTGMGGAVPLFNCQCCTDNVAKLQRRCQQVSMQLACKWPVNSGASGKSHQIILFVASAPENPRWQPIRFKVAAEHSSQKFLTSAVLDPYSMRSIVTSHHTSVTHMVYLANQTVMENVTYRHVREQPIRTS